VGRHLTEIALDEQHSFDDVREAVLSALSVPSNSVSSVIADSEPSNRPMVETTSGFYHDQQLTDSGDEVVTEVLSRFRSGGGTDDVPGL